MYITRKIMAAISVAAVLVIALTGNFARAEEDDREYPLIAAYIYNFTQFTVWPDTVPSTHFTLCVLGTSPFGELLTPLKNKTARGSNFTLRYLSALEGAGKSCNVIFIAGSEQARMKQDIAALKNLPLLTISNVEGFAEAGGMVELTKQDAKIAISINNAAVQSAGLSISSKLLSLAHIVGGT